MSHTLIYENWLSQDSANQNVVNNILNLINRLKMCQDLEVKRMGNWGRYGMIRMQCLGNLRLEARCRFW